MNELSPELAAFRKQSKLFQILMVPGIIALLWVLFFSGEPTNTNMLIAYALLAPGFLGTIFLVIFKKDIAAKNREYSRKLWLEMDSKVRAKRYARNLYLLPLIGFIFLIYTIYFTPNIVSGFYFVFVILSFVWCFFGIIAIKLANLAESKGKSWLAFFWLSLLLSPLITWLVLASVKSDTGKDTKQSESKLSDDLVELNKLFKEGAISADEFTKAKSKLLGI